MSETTLQPSVSPPDPAVDLTVSGSVRRRPRREDVRAALLEAAVEVFEETGYLAARLDVIAERAGYTKGAIYSNFGSKQELFASLLAERLAGITADFLAKSADFSSFGELLQYSAARLADEVLREQAWHTLVVEFTIQAGRDSEVGAVYQAQRRIRRDLLAATIADRAAPFGGSADPNDYSVLAMMLLATVNGLAIEVAADPDGVTREQIRDSLAAVLTAALALRSP
ncbi:TetR/AcrR family transcriptional regulator [Cryobacterium melibiosiphilum]|uniref:TetR/AcrR family transcriptional regulator n=1 Tax=Cryobacterium melibiosiphilum TaxID=995039 RepID=A0A3A5MJY7_9MICO|nr:TetR/AcrR family transcriptional regulator [Cryobacterium melibiosiphilum]RJT85169.1 TetR/AcrR family transcriptional regulator [Cryobacterium melibiosiphilum]